MGVSSAVQHLPLSRCTAAAVLQLRRDGDLGELTPKNQRSSEHLANGDTRRRSIPFTWPGARWEYSDRVFSNPPTFYKGSKEATQPPALQGTQELASENHPGWRSRKKNDNGDMGGPFSVRKRYATLTGGEASIPLNGVIDGWLTRQGRYDGLCVSTVSGAEFPAWPESSDRALEVWGTSAIAKVKPTNVFVDLSSSLAEILHEGIPRLGVSVWESVTDAAREAANHHLAISFGFQPVVSDIYKTLGANLSADAIIRQYLRDAGKTVRRRFDPGVQTTTTTTSLGEGRYPFRYFSDNTSDLLFGSGGEVIRTSVTSRHRWFSGAFTYHLPLDDSMKEMSAKAVESRGLINLDITPETLWNIAPWSWALDWFVPVGDFISNLQDHSSDGLVMKYGYAMEHSVTTDTYTYVGKGSQYVGTLTLTSECKKRVGASPFGFGLSWDGLSPFQLSIAAALGISRK